MDFKPRTKGSRGAFGRILKLTAENAEGRRDFKSPKDSNDIYHTEARRTAEKIRVFSVRVSVSLC